MISALRIYQEAAIAAIRAAFAAGARAVLYVLPTGGGKTVIFSFIAKSASMLGRRVVIIVHRDALVRQASRALSDCGVPHGIIAPGHTRTRDLVQVASVQTLARRLELYEFDLLVIDEAHHATAGTWAKVIAAYPEAHVLGVTATPARTDGRGLAEIFEEIVIGPSIKELIEQGYLVPPIVYGSKKKLDLSRVAVRGGDYDKKQLEAAMDTSSVTGDAVAEYSRLCPGAAAMSFCVTVKHSEDVAADFRAAGYRFKAVHGGLSISEIREAFEDLATGHLQGITSCDLVSEGTDVPNVRAAILLRPTASEALYIQQVGRALRPAPGKDCAIIIDHADNWFRHGGPAAPREWSLEGRKRRPRRGSDELVAVWRCPECLADQKPAPVCMNCGHGYEPGGGGAQAPGVQAGELARIDAELLRVKRRDEVRRARTLEELERIGKERGYKPGWASITYQARGGK